MEVGRPQRSKQDRVNESASLIHHVISGNSPATKKMIDALSALHYDDDDGLCNECLKEWPCPTVTTIGTVRRGRPHG